jgi:saccharopine dehydrogenase (NAD+, L-lysine-forming)
MKGRVLIIGAGAVATVCAHKCAQVPEYFKEIIVASKNVEKCEAIKKAIREKYGRDISVDRVDADDVNDIVEVINRHKPDIVINLALTYHDLNIMEACLITGVHYLDTASYEALEEAHYEYSWQWAYDGKFKERGIMGILGCGFDPGATNAFAAYAQKHLFDEINYLDILDCNGGSHGLPFATNFNPELNIREVLQKGRYWEEGRWIETPSIIENDSIHFSFNYPEVGPRESYLINHEELESLVINIRGIRRARFWMTFSESYLTHLRVLKNVGLTRIDPVDYEGKKVIPLRFLKNLLPSPLSLGKRYKGKTVIGNVMTGRKDGKVITKYIYNVCDHEEAYKETGVHAIAYTAGVPAMIGAMMLLSGEWQKEGVFNVEQLDPDKFMEAMNRYGLPWKVVDWEPIPHKF